MQLYTFILLTTYKSLTIPTIFFTKPALKTLLRTARVYLKNIFYDRTVHFLEHTRYKSGIHVYDSKVSVTVD